VFLFLSASSSRCTSDKPNPGTLWIVSEEVGHFNKGHAAALEELAGFTGIALQMIQSEDRLKSSLDLQEKLTREMGHRVKNVFAIADGMVRISAKVASTKEELAKSLSARLHALAGANALVRRAFDDMGQAQIASNLSDVIEVVLKPYTHSTVKLEGLD
jgi:HWE histidine kinase